MIRTTVHQICDRCMKPFVTKQVGKGEPLPELEKLPEIVITRGEEQILRFEDLCEECREAVENLLKRLRLEPKTAKDGKKADKGQTEEPTAPEADTKEEGGEKKDHLF